MAWSAVAQVHLVLTCSRCRICVYKDLVYYALLRVIAVKAHLLRELHAVPDKSGGELDGGPPPFVLLHASWLCGA